MPFKKKKNVNPKFYVKLVIHPNLPSDSHILKFQTSLTMLKKIAGDHSTFVQLLYY